MPPEDKVRITLPVSDLGLIAEHTLADDTLLKPLRRAKPRNGMIEFDYTYNALDDLLGCVAAECNHAKSKRLEALLDQLYERLVKYEDDD